MERRTVLFVMLSLTIWYGWLAIFPPPAPPEPTDATTTEDGPTVASSAPVAPVAPAPVATDVPERTEPVSLCGTSAVWSNQGGALSTLDLPEYRAPYDVTALYGWVLGGLGAWSPYGEEPGPVRVVSTEGAAFAMGAGALTDAPIGMTGGLASARGSNGRVEVTQSYREVGGDPCTIAVTWTWRNPGSTPFEGPLWLASHDRLPDSGGMMARYTSQSGAQASIDGGVWTLYGYEDLAGPTLVDDGPVEWFGIADRYFAAYVVPAEPHGTLMQTRRQVDGVPHDGMHWVARDGLAPGETHTETAKLYIGVKDMKVLEAADPKLENAVELGWFGFFGVYLLKLLKLFHGWVGNWGIAIILLTVTVKALFFPLTQAAFRSGQAMQAIQPQLAKLKEEFADDQQELNKRTMELFRENNVNPVGGCLPMLLQIPVWIALYNVLLSSVELYQTEFLYLRDLSSVDPYCVLPVVVIAVMVVQQQFTPTANMDPMQAQMMKLMPLIFGLFFFTLPAGLVLYMVVNMVLSVLQQWFIKRTFVVPEPAAAT